MKILTSHTFFERCSSAGKMDNAEAVMDFSQLFLKKKHTLCVWPPSQIFFFFFKKGKENAFGFTSRNLVCIALSQIVPYCKFGAFPVETSCLKQ